jgi:hypothetical protein
MCPSRTYHHGRYTARSARSTASMSLRATYSRLSPRLFGSASRTGPPSTADARKSPSTVAGRTCVNATRGCSIESAW